MKKFTASVFIAAVLAVTGATAASAADANVLPANVVVSAANGGFSIQTGNWPH
jgi:hypothetical protein